MLAHFTMHWGKGTFCPSRPHVSRLYRDQSWRGKGEYRIIPVYSPFPATSPLHTSQSSFPASVTQSATGTRWAAASVSPARAEVAPGAAGDEVGTLGSARAARLGTGRCAMRCAMRRRVVFCPSVLWGEKFPKGSHLLFFMGLDEPSPSSGSGGLLARDMTSTLEFRG